MQEIHSSLQNPWVLPPQPAKSRTKKRKASAVTQRSFAKASSKAGGVLLNLTLCGCILFLCVAFPALLSQTLRDPAAPPAWRLLVVTGGSMEPAIRSGALVLANETPFSKLKEGDVILYSPAAGQVKARRVVAVAANAAVTKGDSALLPDSEPVTPENYLGRVRKVFNAFARLGQAA